MPGVSALVCTYAGDDADHLAAALQSLRDQTRPPDEIVIVEDGPVTPAIAEAIERFQRTSEIPVNRTAHDENRGHGAARATAVSTATHELIAIQDADDISVPERIERSLSKLTETGADLVGGYYEEFETDPEEPHAVRTVPCEQQAIERMAPLRNPINHTTVLARRDAILAAGSYRAVGQMEDYELWARMLTRNDMLVNVPVVLAKVRAGEAMYQRRGGPEHMKEEARLQRHFADIGFVSRPRAAANFVVRSVPKLVPSRLRGWLYRTFFRE